LHAPVHKARPEVQCIARARHARARLRPCRGDRLGAGEPPARRLPGLRGGQGGADADDAQLGPPRGGTRRHLQRACPGAIETERNRALLADAAYREAVLARVPLGRIGSPADCVGATLLLCSPDSSYLNGAVIDVDGGMRL
jgi:hypothetical protein